LLCLALLLLPHPGWRLGWHEIRDHVRAVSSDCGYSDRFVSMALLAVTTSVLLIVLFRPGFNRRLFLVVLAAAGWSLHFGTIVFFHPPLLLFSRLPLSISGSPLAPEVAPAVVFGEMQLTTVHYLSYVHMRRPLHSMALLATPRYSLTRYLRAVKDWETNRR